jgi:hypothetical protein
VVLAGGSANYLLFRRAVTAIRFATERMAPDDAMDFLERRGRGNWIGVLILLALLLFASSGMIQGPVTP